MAAAATEYRFSTLMKILFESKTVCSPKMCVYMADFTLCKKYKASSQQNRASLFTLKGSYRLRIHMTRKCVIFECILAPERVKLYARQFCQNPRPFFSSNLFAGSLPHRLHLDHAANQPHSFLYPFSSLLRRLIFSELSFFPERRRHYEHQHPGQ